MINLVSRLDAVALQQHQSTNAAPMIASTSIIHQDQPPMVMIAANNYAALNMPSSVPYCIQKAGGQIFGKIQVRLSAERHVDILFRKLLTVLPQVSLYYSVSEQQLVVGVHQAMDLPPRADGTGRNPYVKMFLLPDRK